MKVKMIHRRFTAPKGIENKMIIDKAIHDEKCRQIITNINHLISTVKESHLKDNWILQINVLDIIYEILYAEYTHINHSIHCTFQVTCMDVIHTDKPPVRLETTKEYLLELES